MLKVHRKASFLSGAILLPKQEICRYISRCADMNLQCIAIIVALLGCGCAIESRATRESFVAATSSIDEDLNEAAVEDFIVALPSTFHEESDKLFRETVHKARVNDPKNVGRDRDSLYLQGQGANSSMDFLLDRKTSTLKIRVYCWEPGTTPYETTMRRVPGGWMSGPHKKLSGEYHIE